MRAYTQRIAPAQESSFLYRAKAERRFAHGWHRHAELELTLIVASCGTRLVGDNIETYESGDLVLLGPDLPHAWRSDPSFGGRDGARRRLHRAIVVQFREDFLGTSFLQAPELRQVRQLFQAAGRGLQVLGSLRDEVARRLQDLGRAEGPDRLLGLLGILVILAQTRSSLRPLARGKLQIPPPEGELHRIDRVLAYLAAHHTEPINQARVAAILGLSPAGFSRFFRRATGRTFSRYLGELRIGRAAQLLIETDRPILEISFDSGFANLSNFNRRFRSLKGVTPSAFRASHGGAP